MTTINDETPFNLGEWQVEPAKRQAMRGDEVVRIDPRNLRVLQILASRRGEVVPSRDIERVAWDGLVVTADSVYQSISQLRRTLGDIKSPPKYIETVPRKGYRLIAPVEYSRMPDSLTGRESVASPGSAVETINDIAPQVDAGFRYWKAVAGIVAATTLTLALSYFLSRSAESKTKSVAGAVTTQTPADVQYEQALLAVQQGMPDSSYNATLFTQLGDLEMQRGQPAEARKYYEFALAMRERMGGALHVSNGMVLVGLARANLWLEESDAARSAARRATETYQKLTPAANPDLATAYVILAEVLISVGDYDEAEVLVDESLRMTRQTYGEVHTNTLGALGNVPFLRAGQGRYAEAESAARHTLQVATQLRGPRESVVGYWHTSVASALIMRGKYEEALDESRNAVAILKESVQPEHPYIASAQHQLALALMHTGKVSEAERLLTAELQQLTASGAVKWRIARASSALGEALLRQGRMRDAEPRLRFASRELQGAVGWPGAQLYQTTQDRIQELYQMQTRGKPSPNAFANLEQRNHCATTKTRIECD